MAEDQGFSQISMASTQLGKQQSGQRHSIVKNYYVSVILVLMGFYFLVFGIVQLVTNYQQNSVQKEFICTQYQCQIVFQKLSFQLDEDVHIYLSNTAFTQYILEAVNYNKQTIISNCTQFLTNQKVVKQTSYSGAALVSKASAYPCGQIAMSYPEGNFVAKNNDNNQVLAINVDDLSNYQYGFINADLNMQWANVQNQRFQVWSQRNVARGIKKYWGYISQKIPENLKIVLTTHNKIDSKLRSGLRIQLTNNKSLSGYNIALAIFNFLQAIIIFFTGSLSFWMIGKRRYLEQKNSACHSNEEDKSIRSQAPQYSYTINP